MPIAAVPAYLGKDFKDASPGLRFGFYLPIWTSPADQEQELNKRAGKRSREALEIREYRSRHGMEAAIAWLQARRDSPLPGLWQKNTSAADKAWRNICVLTAMDKAAMAALQERQLAIAGLIPAAGRHSFPAISVAPFTTGLGNEHPLENGFAFLWPYGLPYLPGSGVKGVLRQAARELAKGRWGDPQGWSEAAITALFGSEDSTAARRGALAFWDVIPQIKGGALHVEVMTPHQRDYYQGKMAPYDARQPIPIYFLTVPPGSGFTFHVVCNEGLLSRTASDLVQDGRWRTMLQAAFAHAFEWLGFGAKTAVGYGAMALDEAALERQREAEAAAREAAAREAALATATAGLPDDAAWIVSRRHESTWSDNSAFLAQVEAYLEAREYLSAEAFALLSEEMENRWKGIMNDPDATQGKKKKPKFKPRPRELAKKIMTLKEGG